MRQMLEREEARAIGSLDILYSSFWGGGDRFRPSDRPQLLRVFAVAETNGFQKRVNLGLDSASLMKLVRMLPLLRLLGTG